MANTVGIEPSPIAAQMFGNAGREHMKKFGTTLEHFAKVLLNNAFRMFYLKNMKKFGTTLEHFAKVLICHYSMVFKGIIVERKSCLY